MTLSLGEAISGHPLFKPSHFIQHINHTETASQAIRDAMACAPRIFTTGTRHTDIYLKNSSVLPFWQDNYVGDDDDVVVLSRHVMPFAGASDEFDRLAALQ